MCIINLFKFLSILCKNNNVKGCVNHKTELIDFNQRLLNHKLLTVTEQNGAATLSKTQRVHNESKFQHGGSLVQSSTFFCLCACAARTPQVNKIAV